MKKQTLLFLLIIIFFLTISLIGIIHFFYTTVKVMTIEIQATLGDRFGINTDTDKLNFGILKGHATGTRRIFITNDLDQPIIVQLKVSGDITPYIFLSAERVKIAPLDKEEVSISVRFPEGTPEGNYSGALKATFKKNIV